MFKIKYCGNNISFDEHNIMLSLFLSKNSFETLFLIQKTSK